MDQSTEARFRLAFAIFWIVNTIVRMHFQRRVRSSRRAFVRNQKAAALGFRVVAIAYFFLLLYPLTSWLDFAHVGLSTGLRWTCGLALLVFYLVLFSWSHIALGTHWSGIVEIYEDHELVKSGPYRLVRHPMYSAFFLWSFGMALLASNWLILLVYTAALAFMYWGRVSSEEEMMVERFGDAYKEYMNQTGRLMPRLRREKQSR